ncbi:helix-turn-helix domain-containing protein [Listeria booriae]|uniref:helix-turn-helix domain-containing protein n=1 Tax=Listeria booriae TaxID=1552123 RepID=UPI0016252697|nr:helix-turn-helix domain-containing protein [Listeria booriae]MBC2100595.1 helix-turn-helix domain-containing protein [Listeria booriae]MBC2196852.1 helix-turn-helix domain-containing protein [Listeria booriae]MBC2392246.1 helix-turn-helix domain-containing protein [Listeria booriae]
MATKLKKADMKDIVIQDENKMSVTECAAYLEKSVDTIYKMARAKQLPHYKLRNNYYFQKRFLDRYRERQQEVIMEKIEAKWLLETEVN